MKHYGFGFFTIGRQDVWFQPRKGSFGAIIFGWWLHIKAPWNEPLYSERHGISDFRKIGFGWRIAFRHIKSYGESK